MRSLLPLSIVFAAILIPTLAARDPQPRRGARRMLVWVLAFNLVYLAYIALVHPIAFIPEW